MRLKSLEMIGFKSFAEPTVLEFGPGMTVIVGPNGCGKSNISDAVRWVLGEQSAKLLRGAKMEDCIFNGTEERKPLGMAEVSLTLADCETKLQTEYNEITITRRVLRSGEGQYFINKTPCRLKDIQRLFMDTGIGTHSYSLMEQGRIDLILSSRPEDRREIFEEASGITKYKTDKREALRKLEQTEANLLRLADIIKEVKRQIISLQRQAGKATRVKKLKQELRSLDIFVSRGRLQVFSTELQQWENRLAARNESIAAFQADIERLEQQAQAVRQTLAATDSELDAARQSEMDLTAQQQQMRQSLEINQRRISELQEMIRRDATDQAAAARDIDKQRQVLEQTQSAMQKAAQEVAACEQDLRTKSQKNAAHEQSLEQTKQAIRDLHTESMELDDKRAKLQNELSRMENESRSVDRERERRAAEHTNLTQITAGLEKRLAELTANLQQINAETQQAETQLLGHQQIQAKIAQAIKKLEAQRAQHASQIAADQAQLQILKTHLAPDHQRPAGAQQILDAANPGIERRRLLGALSEQVYTSAEWQTALAAVLRHWANAIVVSDWDAALQLVHSLETGQHGAAQILAVQMATAAAPTPPGPGIPLVTQVTCPSEIQPLIERLLAPVRVIDALEQLPASLPPQAIFVTRAGTIASGTGLLEYGCAANLPAEARQRLLTELQANIRRLQTVLQDLDAQLNTQTAQLTSANQALQHAQGNLETKRQALARQEGECQVVTKETNQYRERLETVRWESQELAKQGDALEMRSAMLAEMDRIRARRIEIKTSVETHNHELHKSEQEHKHLLAEVLQANVRLEKQKQGQEHLLSQHTPLAERIAEQESRIEECAQRIQGYQAEIETLTAAMTHARQQIPAGEEEIRRINNRLTEIRQRHATAENDWKAVEEKLKGLREALEEHRNQRQEINGNCIALRLKHQNLSERLSAEYHLASDAIAQEPEPSWPEGQPDAETLDNTIAEMRAKIEAIGPVYEGAIEEYEQLQERFAFLNQQQDDLVKSKHQLLEVIRRINQTTTELFAHTFETINANFQTTFKQLFGGGSAKLMLADDEDILESGIEIIARPPGKRLQSISLLSGGERTLTAVALLFAIYMVKPSPFCMLDELDAALDEPNNRRFIKMLEGFLAQSQFIAITHNQQTIAAANKIYGVTMEETGISKIVSMKFCQGATRPQMEAPETEAAAVSQHEDAPPAP